MINSNLGMHLVGSSFMGNLSNHGLAALSFDQLSKGGEYPPSPSGREREGGGTLTSPLSHRGRGSSRFLAKKEE